MLKFPNHCILNYSKNLGKISSNIFSLKIDDYFSDIYLKFVITQLFLKIFPKYKKNFLKITCVKSFHAVPLNFLRIFEHMSISSEFWNTYKIPQNCRILFSSNYFQCWEKFYPIFSRNCASENLPEV